MAELNPLSKKHEKVLSEYLLCFNQWRAYKKAYPNITDEAARTASSRLFARDDFKNHLEKRLLEEAIQAKNRQPQRQASFVYLILAENGLIKIGKSNDVYGRLKSLDTSSPLKLSLLFYIETMNADELEDALHGIYDDKRIKGEWFSLSDEDVKEIMELYGNKR
jgi:hypothetical protein